MTGRQIPEKLKNFIKKTYGEHCAFPGCKYPAACLHHTIRFSYAKSHDPFFIIPLCKIHHELAHFGLIENEQISPSLWKLRDLKGGILQFAADKKWQKHVKKQP